MNLTLNELWSDNFFFFIRGLSENKKLGRIVDAVRGVLDSLEEDLLTVGEFFNLKSFFIEYHYTYTPSALTQRLLI